MPGDKYTAVWVSHTSISDFLRCPRAYYLKHVYKDPKTKHKVKLMSPALALGSAVHEVLESLSQLPRTERFSKPILDRYEDVWEKVAGKKGGFGDKETEYKFKLRGREMLKRVIDHPGIISLPAVKIQKDLPYFWLSPEENIILCGKIDWLEYLPESDSVRIIDFKTGKNEEDADSLQLPIYHLLVLHCQKRKVSGAAYWYLDSEDSLTPKELPDLDGSFQKVLAVAQKIKLARQLQRFKCPESNGCWNCLPYESILKGESELVGADEYNYDVYIAKTKSEEDERESVIL
ncbi:MAG: PD-(D/E)XK nuclease family protein [Patescibacteria group bacterium]